MNDDDDEDMFVLCDTVQKCDFESYVFCGVILTKKKRRKKKCVFGKKKRDAFFSFKNFC